jgi:hypothetical protein
MPRPIGIGGTSYGPMSESRRNFRFPYSPFIITLRDGDQRILSVVKNESFVFVVNGEGVQSNAIDAVLISRKVHDNLQSTPKNLQFIGNDESITPEPLTIFSNLLSLVVLVIFHEMNDIRL